MKCRGDNTASRSKLCNSCTPVHIKISTTESNPVVPVVVATVVESTDDVGTINSTLQHIKNRQDAISILTFHADNERANSTGHLFRVANYYFSINDVGRGTAFFRGAFDWIRGDPVSNTISTEADMYTRGGKVRLSLP